MVSLHRLLYSTVAYFDVLGLPVTPLQCLPWCARDAARLNVPEALAELSTMSQSGHLEEHNGFFVLKGKHALIRAMHQRRALLHRKWKVASWAAMLFAHIPFVEAVCASGSLTLGNVHEASDVDLFIVARRDCLWRARFLTTLIMKFLRRRPGEGRRDPLCLSFYVTRDALDLYPLRADDGDIHFAFWSASLAPLFDRGGVFTAFREANAHWWGAFFAAGRSPLPPLRVGESDGWVKHVLIQTIVRLVSAMLTPDFFERIVRTIQMHIMPTTLKRRAGEGTTHVVISDTALKFHINDRRVLYHNAWQERLARCVENAPD